MSHTQTAPGKPGAVSRALASDRLGIPAVLFFVLAGVGQGGDHVQGAVAVVPVGQCPPGGIGPASCMASRRSSRRTRCTCGATGERTRCRAGTGSSRPQGAPVPSSRGWPPDTSSSSGRRTADSA
jgi:hypothetical protein